MAHPLQNHPGLQARPELPLRASWRNLSLDARANGALPTAVASWVVLGAGILFFLLWVENGPLATFREVGGDVGALVDTAGPGMVAFWVIAALVGVACLGLGAHLGLTAVRRPLREQRRYYRLRGLTEVSERQRRALRVGGHWWHLKATWPLSMECFPTSSGLTERQVTSFRTFLPEPADKDRDDLAADWGILNAQEARSTIDQHLIGGVHSHALAATLHEGDASTVDRWAAIADVPTARLLELGDRRDGHPPQLLWGWDLVRTMVLVRFSVIAGYLSVEEGLTRLEEITDYVVTLFPTEQELIDNCIIGFAIWDGVDQRAELRARRQRGEEYLRGEWPAALGPWPTSSGRPLPPAMADESARSSPRTEPPLSRTRETDAPPRHTPWWPR